MEGLTRLVSESLARHGFDRPVDYRRLKWSSWFRCESHHSLLFVPSKPGVFAIAEAITTHVATTASVVTRSGASGPESPNPEAGHMLAVSQIFEADDMAYVLDRMLSQKNPMREHLESGRYFVRFVVIEDQAQRRSIATALNQWIVASAEKATGVARTPSSATAETFDVARTPSSAAGQALLFSDAETLSTEAATAKPVPAPAGATTPLLNSGAATNIHCPAPFPSGF